MREKASVVEREGAGTMSPSVLPMVNIENGRLPFWFKLVKSSLYCLQLLKLKPKSFQR
jgi:hypothetical protein